MFEKKPLFETIILFLLFAMGMVLVITSFVTFGKLTPECPNSLKIKLRIALGAGAAIASLSAGYLLCNITCPESKTINIIMGISLVLGISIVVLLYMIKNEVEDCGINIQKKDITNNTSSLNPLDISDYIYILQILSGLIVGIPILHFIYVFANKQNDEKSVNPYKKLRTSSPKRQSRKQKRQIRRKKQKHLEDIREIEALKQDVEQAKYDHEISKKKDKLKKEVSKYRNLSYEKNEKKRQKAIKEHNEKRKEYELRLKQDEDEKEFHGQFDDAFGSNEEVGQDWVKFNYQ